MDKKLIVWFDEVDKDDVGLVGGKGANLGEMLSGGFPIPYGFIVTSHAYFYVVEQNRLKHRIKHAVTNINYENSKELHAASSQIKKLFLKAEIPEDLTKTIVSYYHELVLRESRVFRKNKLQKALKHVKSAINSPLTAVRSSATAEDLPEASFAGQQDTFLNVKGENHLLEKVKACWASLFTERAMYYRHNNGFDHMKVGLAAVVQRMVQSQQSGIAFSIDPVTNDKSVISIEAILGLGEYIVQGKVTPDHYEISKSTYAIINKQIKTQKIKLVKRGVDTREVKVPRTKGESQKISDKTIVELAKIIHAIEKHYYFPQDIEWAVEEGQIFIVQSRPITTINTKTKTDKLDTQGFKVILKGSPASPGIASGEPVVVNSPSEISKVKKGMVLVARQTSPDYVPAMKRAAAIVTEVGGRTSHAAIVSRELSVPAVVGAEDAKTLLSGISTISVNGSTGEVYEGVVHGSSSAQSGATDKLDYITKRLQTVYAGHGETLDKQTVEQKAKQSRAKLKTVTKIYVNLAQTEKAKEVAQKNVDGVGLLRAEFIIADIGTHPRKIIQKGQQKEFIKVLSERLIDVVKPFAPRPVVYRTTDFKTNEYSNLKGGEKFEEQEENPMLGFRGASRYIAGKEVFNMELAAIKRVRAKGYKNLHVMLPFVRTTEELSKVRELIAQSGLLSQHSFKLWIMIEIPSNVILLEDFIKVGIDGVSIGTNDLTMLLLGVDRDNPKVAQVYKETDPAVLWALDRVARVCKKHNVTVSICGQAPSDYPEIVEKLVLAGITSISVNIDAIDQVREQTYLLESLIWQKSKK